MPLVALNNWSVRRLADGRVVVTAWMTDKDGVLIKSFLVLNPKTDGEEATASVGKGVQNKLAVYRRYEFILPANAVKPTEGTGGWATSVLDGKTRITLTLGIHNREQNPKYPIQTPEEINQIIGSVGADAGKKKKVKPAAPAGVPVVEANVDSDEE